MINHIAKNSLFSLVPCYHHMLRSHKVGVCDTVRCTFVLNFVVPCRKTLGGYLTMARNRDVHIFHKEISFHVSGLESFYHLLESSRVFLMKDSSRVESFACSDSSRVESFAHRDSSRVESPEIVTRVGLEWSH